MRPAGLRDELAEGPSVAPRPCEPAARSAADEPREVRRPPVRDVAVELGGRKEAPQRLVLEARHDDRLGLHDGQLTRHRRDAPQRRQRLLHVVQDAEVEHDVPRADRREVARHEVGHDRLDAAAQRLAREVEAALARQRVGMPELGLVVGPRGDPLLACSAASRPAGRASPSTTCSGRRPRRAQRRGVRPRRRRTRPSRRCREPTSRAGPATPARRAPGAARRRSCGRASRRRRRGRSNATRTAPRRRAPAAAGDAGVATRSRDCQLPRHVLGQNGSSAAISASRGACKSRSETTSAMSSGHWIATSGSA